jgi:hypothetical protein
VRFWLGLLLFVGLGYQLFFRYERWPDHEHPGSFFERDNLTGMVQVVKPGQQTGNWLARFFGDDGEISQSSDNISAERYFDTYEGIKRDNPVKSPAEPEKSVNLHLQADSEKIISQRQTKNRPPVPSPKNDTIASSANPPVPMAMLAADVDDVNDTTPPFAVRQVDLNRDGIAEEIIQNAVHPDGLLDISIVKNGREIFFGRGKQIKLLSTRSTEGWEDIGLKSAEGATRVYRYSPKESAYIATQ